MGKLTDFSKINFVIFDWDGTLADSMDFYAENFARLISDKFEANHQEVKDFYLSLAGTTLSSEIKLAAERFGQKNIKDTLELEDEFWKLMEGRLSPKLIPGAIETLEKFKQKNKKLIIWSGTKTEVLESQTKRLDIDHLIDFCIGTKSGPNQATKGPQFFKIIAQHFKMRIEDLEKEAIVIGDGPGDMEAANECNCFAIGVLKTCTRENLENAGADFIIEKIDDIITPF